MKRNFIKNVACALIICSATLIGGTAASAATVTKTNQVSINKKDKNSYIYDNKKLPENLKKLIPKELEDKAIVQHVGKYNVDVITLPKSTESSKTTSNSLTLDSVPTNGGIVYQNSDLFHKVIVRGIEDHHGSGPHFNINTQYRFGGDMHDYHFTYEGQDSYSNQYTWRMSNTTNDVEKEIIGYGAEEEAASSASYEMLEIIAEEDGAEVRGLTESGLPVIVELLIALIAL